MSSSVAGGRGCESMESSAGDHVGASCIYIVFSTGLNNIMV